MIVNDAPKIVMSEVLSGLSEQHPGNLSRAGPWSTQETSNLAQQFEAIS
jgi:hypothetical protein